MFLENAAECKNEPVRTKLTAPGLQRGPSITKQRAAQPCPDQPRQLSDAGRPPVLHLHVPAWSHPLLHTSLHPQPGTETPGSLHPQGRLQAGPSLRGSTLLLAPVCPLPHIGRHPMGLRWIFARLCFGQMRVVTRICVFNFGEEPHLVFDPFLSAPHPWGSSSRLPPPAAQQAAGTVPSPSPSP